MTGVLSENMAANHLILIFLCSRETADMRGKTRDGGRSWEVEVGSGGANCASAQNIKVPHTHLHTDSKGQWSIAFSLSHLRHGISLDGLP